MKVFVSVFSAVVALALMGAKPVALRLDVTAQPEGAQVSVDGTLRGTAPCSVFDLQTGTHLVHVAAPACEPADAFVALGEENPFVQKNFSLVPRKALILLKTHPAGADVKYDGVSLGTTPLLVTTLASDVTHVPMCLRT